MNPNSNSTKGNSAATLHKCHKPLKSRDYKALTLWQLTVDNNLVDRVITYFICDFDTNAKILIATNNTRQR